MYSICLITLFAFKTKTKHFCHKFSTFKFTDLTFAYSDLNSYYIFTYENYEGTSFKQKKNMKKMKLILFFVALSCNVNANELIVSNVNVNGQNTVSDFYMVKFDITWNNSWRVSSGPSNWDAAWVFVKYRKNGQNTWNHASLNWVDGTGTGDGHTEPANSNIASANDNGSGNSFGVFIYRDADMVPGSVNYTNVGLRWEYGDDGLLDGDLVEVCVFAIEMVYVPQGSFELGSGGTEIDHFYRYPTTTDTYTISNENAITVGTAAGNLYYETILEGGDQMGPIPSAFPKGYNAFYCMKYEITQEQYTVFLNKLTYTQQETRTVNAPNSAAGTGALITGNLDRCGIDIMTPGVSITTPAVYACNLDGDTDYDESVDGQNNACNHLSWANVAAYLDWVGLRPMTELEYEKACRGDQAAVPNEYAWGSTTITQVTGISNSGANNETANNGGANCTHSWHANVQGPMRSGCLGQGVNTREGIGATYYGILEMSGNVWERPVSAGHPTGRAFTGINGDGVLDATGNTNSINWPSTTSTGTSFRGGDYANPQAYARVSDRYYADWTYASGAYNFGGRGVRVAP
jgi:formylglycine-generating enzyme required for sulfatase activity